jgi:hypothetical protein
MGIDCHRRFEVDRIEKHMSTCRAGVPSAPTTPRRANHKRSGSRSGHSRNPSTVGFAAAALAQAALEAKIAAAGDEEHEEKKTIEPTPTITTPVVTISSDDPSIVAANVPTSSTTIPTSEVVEPQASSAPPADTSTEFVPIPTPTTTEPETAAVVPTVNEITASTPTTTPATTGVSNGSVVEEKKAMEDTEPNDAQREAATKIQRAFRGTQAKKMVTHCCFFFFVLFFLLDNNPFSNFLILSANRVKESNEW